VRGGRQNQASKEGLFSRGLPKACDGMKGKKEGSREKPEGVGRDVKAALLGQGEKRWRTRGDNGRRTLQIRGDKKNFKKVNHENQERKK